MDTAGIFPAMIHLHEAVYHKSVCWKGYGSQTDLHGTDYSVQPQITVSGSAETSYKGLLILPAVPQIPDR